MEQVEIPSYFLCPISLQIMRDPVTLTTGITYDRESIERWIFAGKHETCPVTKQPLPDHELTPNHTLRRLIQAWCTAANGSNGVERFPTPRPPVDKAQIAALLEEAEHPHSQISALRRLKAIVSESEHDKRCVESSGAVDFLASLIKKSKSKTGDHQEREGYLINDGIESSSASSAGDEALDVLYSLQISEQSLLHLIERNDDFIESLTTILRRSNNRSRAYAILLLKSLVSAIARTPSTSFGQEFFEEVVSVLRDQISPQATKAALQVLGVLIGPRGRNKVKAVEAGAVQVVIELLLEQTEKRACEMMLVVLDRLCGCAEGRAEMVGHAAGLAVVSKKVLGVSRVAGERAVRVVYSVARFSPTPAVLHEMVQVGVVTKLCMFLQVDAGKKAKEKAKEILRLHSKVWRNSLCLVPQFLASYPC